MKIWNSSSFAASFAPTAFSRTLLVGVLASLCLAWTCGRQPTQSPAEVQDQLQHMISSLDGRFSVPQVDARDLMDATGQPLSDVVLVDLRTISERQVSVLPGAVSTTNAEGLQAAVLDATRAGKRVVLYCTIGYRSGRAAEQLNKNGAAVSNLRGGILAWTHAGGSLHDLQGAPTKRVHVFGHKWDLLPEGFESVLQ
jgi:rhodanese-related sulfurtransferase